MSNKIRKINRAMSKSRLRNMPFLICSVDVFPNVPKPCWAKARLSYYLADGTWLVLKNKRR